MIKKITILGILLFLVISSIYSQNDSRELPFSHEILERYPPMRGWTFNQPTSLNGRLFMTYEYAQSYREQSARVAYPGGSPNTYWLYDSYTYHNGNSTIIRDQIVPQWLEGMGYTIDYDKIRTEVSEDKFIIPAVKTVMTQRNCDVAITVDLRRIRHWSTGNTPNRDIDYIGFVIINEYNRATRRYSYTYIPTTIMNIGQ